MAPEPHQIVPSPDPPPPAHKDARPDGCRAERRHARRSSAVAPTTTKARREARNAVFHVLGGARIEQRPAGDAAGAPVLDDLAARRDAEILVEMLGRDFPQADPWSAPGCSTRPRARPADRGRCPSDGRGKTARATPARPPAACGHSEFSRCPLANLANAARPNLRAQTMQGRPVARNRCGRRVLSASEFEPTPIFNGCDWR